MTLAVKNKNQFKKSRTEKKCQRPQLSLFGKTKKKKEKRRKVELHIKDILCCY